VDERCHLAPISRYSHIYVEAVTGFQYSFDYAFKATENPHLLSALTGIFVSYFRRDVLD